MHPTLVPLSYLAADLQAKGFAAGVGKLVLGVIVVLVLVGVFIGFSLAKRRR